MRLLRAWWNRTIEAERARIRQMIEADRYPDRPITPMAEHLAALPPPPPPFVPEWQGDTTWKDDR